MPYKKSGETLSPGVAIASNYSPIRRGLAVVLMIGLMISSALASSQQTWLVALDTGVGTVGSVTVSLQSDMSDLCPSGVVTAQINGSGDALSICLNACGQLEAGAGGDLALIQTLDAQGAILQTFLLKVSDGVVIVVLTDD